MLHFVRWGEWIEEGTHSGKNSGGLKDPRWVHGVCGHLCSCVPLFTQSVWFKAGCSISHKYTHDTKVAHPGDVGARPTKQKYLCLHCPHSCTRALNSVDRTQCTQARWHTAEPENTVRQDTEIQRGVTWEGKLGGPLSAESLVHKDFCRNVCLH